MKPLRVAILAAFPFPYPQGSQIYVTQQTRALAEAGADPCLFTYGSGEGELPRDLQVLRAPGRLSPPVFRSGPQWRKPIADGALLARYLSANREHPFDVALAHNVEAALVALAARPLARVPVVYCAHTLMRHELSAYAPPSWKVWMDRVGRGLDDAIARRADGIVALCNAAAQQLGALARGPLAIVPPGLEEVAAPDLASQRDACARHGLEPRGFALYSGNLDAYQELEILSAATREPGGPKRPLVVACHDATGPSALRESLRHVEVRDFAEMRALCFAAGSLILTRRRVGGFPIKLLNYMETGRPIVAYEQVAEGLEDGRSAALLPRDAGSAELASILAKLERDPDLAERLGEGARRHLDAHHRWPTLARQTLALLGESEALARRARL